VYKVATVKITEDTGFVKEKYLTTSFTGFTNQMEIIICYGMTLLGWISRRWDLGIWTGLGWPRIETGGGRL